MLFIKNELDKSQYRRDTFQCKDTYHKGLQVFQKQPIMRKVLYSLLPIFVFSLLLYGWRSLVITLTVFVSGILSEYVFTRTRKKKVSEAVLVSCALYALSMPPGVPLWIAALGISFGIVFAKNVYGGFGRNIFNPAIAARLFVYIAFPHALQRSFIAPWRPGLPWRFGLDVSSDAVSAATPLASMKEGILPPLEDLLLGFRSGSLGESAILLILMAAVYLLITKTANYRLMLASFVSFVIASAALRIAGFMPDQAALLPGLTASLFSGSILFVCVFMVTDPVSAPNKGSSQWVYAILVGSLSAIIRVFSLFPEAVSFAVLVANTFACLLDEWFPATVKKSGGAGK